VGPVKWNTRWAGGARGERPVWQGIHSLPLNVLPLEGGSLVWILALSLLTTVLGKKNKK
jgi:hypothetical protein